MRSVSGFEPGPRRAIVGLLVLGLFNSYGASVSAEDEAVEQAWAIPAPGACQHESQSKSTLLIDAPPFPFKAGDVIGAEQLALLVGARAVLAAHLTSKQKGAKTTSQLQPQ